MTERMTDAELMERMAEALRNLRPRDQRPNCGCPRCVASELVAAYDALKARQREKEQTDA